MSFRKKNIPVTTQSKPNPFLPIQNELNRAMGDFYHWFEPFNFHDDNFENLIMSPAIDIVEDKDQFKVEAEMPGMDESDVKISIDNGMLTIKGEKTISQKNKEKNYMSREISYGSYERKVSLPESLDTEKAKATFKKGMLWVTFPKRPEFSKASREIVVEKTS